MSESDDTRLNDADPTSPNSQDSLGSPNSQGSLGSQGSQGSQGLPGLPGSPNSQGWPSWQAAWDAALYQPGGFYLRPEGPAGHFRTAAHADGPELAAAIRRLAHAHGCTTIVDVGAGRGELLTAVAAINAPDHHRPDSKPTDPDARFRLWAVDVVDRPPQLPTVIGWSRGLAALPDQVLAGALLIGWELLDVVPCPVLELDSAGQLRQVLVEPQTGRERLGPPVEEADLQWCRKWWPTDLGAEGDRVEVGAARDRLWAELTARAFAAGARALLAVDYAHLRTDRPALGSLTGFRAGRALPPRPDGSMDLTAHVAIDAVAAAGTAALAAAATAPIPTPSLRSQHEIPTPLLRSQHEALRELGVRSDELLDPGGLGGFSWLLQPLRSVDG